MLPGPQVARDCLRRQEPLHRYPVTLVLTPLGALLLAATPLVASLAPRTYSRCSSTLHRVAWALAASTRALCLLLEPRGMHHQHVVRSFLFHSVNALASDDTLANTAKSTGVLAVGWAALHLFCLRFKLAPAVPSIVGVALTGVGNATTGGDGSGAGSGANAGGWPPLGELVVALSTYPLTWLVGVVLHVCTHVPRLRVVSARGTPSDGLVGVSLEERRRLAHIAHRRAAAAAAAAAAGVPGGIARAEESTHGSASNGGAGDGVGGGLKRQRIFGSTSNLLHAEALASSNHHHHHHHHHHHPNHHPHVHGRYSGTYQHLSHSNTLSSAFPSTASIASHATFARGSLERSRAPSAALLSFPTGSALGSKAPQRSNTAYGAAAFGAAAAAHEGATTSSGQGLQASRRQPALLSFDSSFGTPHTKAGSTHQLASTPSGTPSRLASTVVASPPLSPQFSGLASPFLEPAMGPEPESNTPTLASADGRQATADGTSPVAPVGVSAVGGNVVGAVSSLSAAAFGTMGTSLEGKPQGDEAGAESGLEALPSMKSLHVAGAADGEAAAAAAEEPPADIQDAGSPSERQQQQQQEQQEQGQKQEQRQELVIQGGAAAEEVMMVPVVFSLTVPVDGEPEPQPLCLDFGLLDEGRAGVPGSESGPLTGRGPAPPSRLQTSLTDMGPASTQEDQHVAADCCPGQVRLEEQGGQVVQRELIGAGVEEEREQEEGQLQLVPVTGVAQGGLPPPLPPLSLPDDPMELFAGLRRHVKVRRWLAADVEPLKHEPAESALFPSIKHVRSSTRSVATCTYSF